MNLIDAKGLKQGYWEEHTRHYLEKGLYVDNKREGDWKIFSKDNRFLWAQGPYKNGMRHGDWEEYQAILDIIVAKGSYLEDQKNGYWEEYNDGWGDRITKGYYLKGNQIGYWYVEGLDQLIYLYGPLDDINAGGRRIKLSEEPVTKNILPFLNQLLTTEEFSQLLNELNL